MAEGTAGHEAARDAPLCEDVHRVDAPSLRRHAVVAHQQERGRRPGAARVEAREQAAELVVLAAQRLARLGRIGPVGVALRVGAVPPGHHEPRPLGGRQIEPAEDPVDLLGLGHRGVEGRLVVGRRHALPGRLGPHPEERRGAHALALGGHPERLRLDPARVVRVVEEPALPVDEGVGDDAVAVDRRAGRERDVVGKGARREDRHQRVGAQPLPGDAREGGQLVAIEIVGAHAVQREQDHERGGLG